MRLTAKVDYALRAVCALASARPGSLTSDAISESEDVPRRFLETILTELRRAGVVTSRRGPDGGHTLAADPDALSIADVIRIIDGPLATVRNLRPEELEYVGASTHLVSVWMELRRYERDVLENMSIGRVIRGDVPAVSAADVTGVDGFVYDI